MVRHSAEGAGLAHFLVARPRPYGESVPITGASLAMIVMLLPMHIVAVVVVVDILTTLARARQDRKGRFVDPVTGRGRFRGDTRFLPVTV